MNNAQTDSTASPSAGCPTDYKVTCDPSRGSSGRDTCGYTCYRCCDDTCPSGTSKNYHGSYASTTECGSRCNRCKNCTSGSTSYSGSYVGSSECGSCYACSDTCRSGQKSVSCSSNYVKTRVSTTECGTACYSCEANPDCSVTSKYCSYGCASYNSCDKCTSCKSKPATTYTFTAADCANLCRDVGTNYIHKDGIIYYSVCGYSKCSGAQTCDKGICKSHFYCCDDTGSYCGDYDRCKSGYAYFEDCSTKIPTMKKQGYTVSFAICDMSPMGIPGLDDIIAAYFYYW